ncbi:MAG: L-seryl-tRNA(Sec) selenium transferase [Hyphomicrobiaceae bacterium]
MLENASRRLSALPSIGRLLETESAMALVRSFGRTAVTGVLREVLEERRSALRTGRAVDLDLFAILAQSSEILKTRSLPSLRPVFNMTGTVLHTNLGRSALPDAAIAAIAEVAHGACTLEFDVRAGARGDRDTHVVSDICAITGATDATVVNNNAAAIMLVLNTLAPGRDVPVSRGELVEIGGSFRIPDIMARSGCHLVEVGTTNRTHLSDFANAIGPQTAMIMKVHASNYVIEGFTKVVPEKELASLCRDHGIPFVNDLGSGTLVNLEDFGLPHEPTPMDALRSGADIVTFSGDKLLGGPQAGIIVGRKDLIAQIKSNPMRRALRCDKLTIAALSEVLRIYRNPDRLAEQLPVLSDLSRPVDEIRTVAERVLAAFKRFLGGKGDAIVVDCYSEIGSGALPMRTLASAGVGLYPSPDEPSEGKALKRIAAALRALPVPVIGRIHNGALILDMRCLRDEEKLIEQLSHHGSVQ